MRHAVNLSFFDIGHEANISRRAAGTALWRLALRKAAARRLHAFDGAFVLGLACVRELTAGRQWPGYRVRIGAVVVCGPAGKPLFFSLPVRIGFLRLKGEMEPILHSMSVLLGRHLWKLPRKFFASWR